MPDARLPIKIHRVPGGYAVDLTGSGGNFVKNKNDWAAFGYVEARRYLDLDGSRVCKVYLSPTSP